MSDGFPTRITHLGGMPRYRRAWRPGGTYFFMVNVLERDRRLLVDPIDSLRMAFRAAHAARPFEVIAAAPGDFVS